MFSFAYNSLPFTASASSPPPSSSSETTRRRNMQENLGYSKYATDGYTTNNRYPSFPPLMNDSRSLISSWNTETQWDNSIITRNRIDSNWKYRRFLNTHASQIMKDQYIASCNDTGAYLENIYKTESVGSNSVRDEVKSIPYHYTSYTSTAKPEGYNDSDLKSSYLEKDQLESRRFRPTFQQ